MQTRILILDIETTPHDVYTWGVWQQNVAPNQLKVPTRMIMWSARFLGERKRPTVRNESDDGFITDLAALFAEADVVVTYNGDKFDLLHINRELAERKLPPLRPVASVDLLKVVKQRFKLPYYRLDYVAGLFLGKGKTETGGFGLWQGYMNGEAKAIRKMAKYNQDDVILTEELYEFLIPWIKNHPYVGAVSDIADSAFDYECPACQNDAVILLRPRRTRCYAIRVLCCAACGHYFDGKRKKL